MRRSAGWRALAALLVLVVAACTRTEGWTGAVATGRCQVTPAAELAFLKDRNFAVVPATIDGTLVSMMVDTGSETTLVTPDAAQRLGLRPDALRRSLLRGVGGTVISRNALLQQFALGSLVVRDRSFSVGALPGHFVAQPPVAGLLGADVLAPFDIDFDVPHGRMALYRVIGCGPQTLDDDFATDNHVVSVPLRRTQAGRLIMTVQVDGHSLTAILDTGAAGTIMTRQAAARLGVTPALLALDSADTGHGVDMNDIPVRRHRFASVRIGRELFRDVPLAVADVQLGGPDMLLGFDYLRQRRVWISYATGRMYVQAAPTRPALDRSPAHSWAGILVR